MLLAALRRHTSDLRSYSRAFLRNGITAHLDQKMGCQLIKEIRRNYKGRMLASPVPLISEESNFFKKKTIRPQERAIVEEIVCNYFKRNGADYVQQPATTIVDNRYTAQTYCVDSSGFLPDIQRPPDDYRHMNKFYGREVLQAITETLGC
jgi:hypothetical protein